MNAKEEFLKETGDKFILCAEILSSKYYDDTGMNVLFNESEGLKIRYKAEDFAEFLRKLNFEYNNGYGGQTLFGTIWYADGTWSERGEYDGSE